MWQVSICPECRLPYHHGRPRRHRYAEMALEELANLRVEREQIQRSGLA